MKPSKTAHIYNVATKLPVPALDTYIIAANAYHLLNPLFHHRDTLAGFWINYGISSLLFTYAISSLADYFSQRFLCKYVNLERDFGTNPRKVPPSSAETRTKEIKNLVEILNDEYTPQNYPNKELAVIVNEAVTEYISGITGQRVESSNRFRNWGISLLLFPFASAATDGMGGEVYLSKKVKGVFAPAIIAHEFVHRKGYSRELSAQVLAYFALTSSSESVLKQSANCERLYRDLISSIENRHRQRYASPPGARSVFSDPAFSNQCAIAGTPPVNTLVEKADFNKLRDQYLEYIGSSALRAELKEEFVNIRPKVSRYQKAVTFLTYPLMKARFAITGQSVQDYGDNFVNFLRAVENKENSFIRS